VTADIGAILDALDAFLKLKDSGGRIICAAKFGVYAFFDYDGEPIYVGQTYERLSTRIRRHLTNQRTDAVAMHVLDPMEVARVEVWPFRELSDVSKEERKSILNRAEFTVFSKLAGSARVSKLLNEKEPMDAETIELPESSAADIVPEDVKARLGHADERIARRAATIANLAQVVRERDVSVGLRGTLVTQAERLELLAKLRLQEVIAETPAEQLAEETKRAGDDEASG
jgi:hypothetical protein